MGSGCIEVPQSLQLCHGVHDGSDAADVVHLVQTHGAETLKLFQNRGFTLDALSYDSLIHAELFESVAQGVLKHIQGLCMQCAEIIKNAKRPRYLI